MARKTRRRRAHGRHLRPVADPERQRAEPRLDVRHAQGVRRARAAELTADAIAAASCERCRRAKSARRVVTVFGAPPIDGLGTTGGFKLIIEDRGNLGLDELQQRQRPDRRRRQRHAAACKACSTARAPTRPGCTSTSTAPSAMALGVPISDVFNTLQVYLGSYYVNNFNEFGRTWQVNVQADPRFRDRVRRHPAAAGAQQPGADGPAGHAADGARHQRPGDGDALQHVLRRRHHRQHGARASAPGRRSR